MGSEPLTGEVRKHFWSTSLEAQRNLVKLTCKDWLPLQPKICYCTCSSRHWLQLSLARVNIHIEVLFLLFINGKAAHLCVSQFHKNRSDVLHCLAKLRSCCIPSQKRWSLKMGRSPNEAGVSKARALLLRVKKQAAFLFVYANSHIYHNPLRRLFWTVLVHRMPFWNLLFQMVNIRESFPRVSLLSLGI